MDKFIVLSTAMGIIEQSIIFILCNSLFVHRFNKKKHYILFVAFIIISISSLIFLLSTTIINRHFVNLVVCLILLKVLYTNKWYQVLTILILSVYSITAIDIVLGHLMALVLNDNLLNIFSTDLTVKAIVSVIIKLANAFLFLWFYFMFKNIMDEIKLKQWKILCVSIFAFWVIGILFLYIYPYGIIDENLNKAFLYSSSGFFLSSLVMIYFFSKFCFYFKAERKLFLLENNYKGIQKQIAIQEQSTKKILKTQHDMKSHVSNAAMIIEQENNNAAKELIKKCMMI